MGKVQGKWGRKEDEEKGRRKMGRRTEEGRRTHDALKALEHELVELLLGQNYASVSIDMLSFMRR